MKLARLEKVELRNQWKDEAKDFTPWLAEVENIELLGEAIGMELEVIAKEERVGSFSIFPDEDRKVYDIGYCIRKTHWRKGYASEALVLMLDWAKSQGAEKVTAEVAVGNTASNALLHKFGFAVEKKAQFRKYNMDICFDSFIYAKEL